MTINLHTKPVQNLKPLYYETNCVTMDFFLIQSSQNNNQDRKTYQFKILEKRTIQVVLANGVEKWLVPIEPTNILEKTSS